MDRQARLLARQFIQIIEDMLDEEDRREMNPEQSQKKEAGR